jgi:dephospho-CoA kinase
MLNAGLTGGIATGKSTVARMLVERGAILIDLDELAHEVEAPGGEVWMQIVRRFGEGILFADGAIDRGKLGAIVFADSEKLKLLNGIVHPAVFARWKERLGEIREKTPRAIVLSAIPLLIEAGMTEMVDLVVLVYISREKQVERLIERNGFSREEAMMRISSQMPIEEKLSHADVVIPNEGTVEETERTLDSVWEEFKKREKLISLNG